ncbi:MAG: YidC/Oxa1 family membrane protein insertase [Acidimicrobiales bacterium]
MFDAIARILAFFYDLPVVGGSYGLAIIMLTATVMMVLMPLTIMATKSTLAMQRVQPQLKELQRKHKNDRETLNAELMQLYRDNGINPVGGCLPMLAQLPVFLVLFRVLRGLSRHVSETPFFGVAEHARSLVGIGAANGNTFDPQYLDHGSKLYIDLTHDTTIGFGPTISGQPMFDLGQHPLDAIQSSLVRGIPYLILVLFVVATSYYQQRQISARRGATVVNPQQEMIMKFLPLLSGFWAFAFPTGLVLYMATSNLFRIGQQSYLTHTVYKDDEQKSDRDEEKEGSSAADDSEGKDRSSGKSSSAGRSGGGSGGSTGKGRRKAGATADVADDVGTDGSSVTNGSRNGSNLNGRSTADGESRSEVWDRRKRERAKARDASKNRTTQSSRVTPKGTKPSGSKKKRKR